MAGQRRHLDGLEGEQRQRCRNGVQLVVIGNIEDADVGILAR